MNNTVIVPIHEINDEYRDYLVKAIESVANQININELPKVIIVYTADIDDSLMTNIKLPETTNKLSITYLKNTGSSDYQSQVNFAVNHVTTDYFSVLEFDDEYSQVYFNVVNRYINTYPQIDVFLPIIVEVNDNNQGIKLTNELTWSQQVIGENGELGYLNHDILKQFTDFNLSGAVFKKSEFINIGGYKSNIKLTFMHEFLLRAINNACKVYTIPKIGYKHWSTRINSLFDNYKKTMNFVERRFWYNVAIKEYVYTNDRPIDMSVIYE